ncbi:putative reverse transcriptase domain, ribonuclease H-like domain, aspartic peptidase domain protein [Tanacetum coccineum]|uniref:Reverse transcriptase domain, ribonuclease H-like domain, aspartic peptidase domain protein n=1 Tax=Tanacetum coccineum TaxID=301880 RepID=A0ABQ4X7J7_9ASTR
MRVHRLVISSDLLSASPHGTHNARLLRHGTNVSHWIPKRIGDPLEGLKVTSVTRDWENILSSREVESLLGLRTIAVACGIWHTSTVVEVIVTRSSTGVSSGKLFTWGDGDKRRLGHGDREPRLKPTCVPLLIDYNFHKVACGHSLTVGFTTSVTFHIFRIMPPRRFKKKSVRKIVEKRVARAIEKYEKTITESNNAGGSRSANTKGTVAPDMHGCSYKTFMNCKPHSFNGTEDDKVKFAMCTFEGRALTWWNGNVQTLGLANANQIPWSNVKAMMTTEYCPATEIQRMEQELWTLTLKGDDIEAYNNRFHELVLMCPELVSTEKKKIEKYIRGFPEGIKGNVTSSKPATLHDAINMARELIEQGVQAKALRIGDSNKRKWEDQQGNNYHQQQNRRQEAAKVYVAAPAKGRGYAGNLPWCNRCKAHHQPGPCPPRCGKCHKLGHQEGDCRTRIPVARDNSLQNVTCFGCGNHGHYRKSCARRFKKKSVKRIVEKRVAKAIEEYEKTRADSNNTGGSGSANTGGTVAPDVHGCSYKTFMNGKPHSFSGTEGVVGLKCWFEKMEQVFEICKCAEDDKTLTLKGDDIEAYNNRFHELVLMCPELVSTEKKKIEKYIRGFPEGIKGNVTSSKPATLHDAINMARELIEQGVQAKALRIGDSNKRKWENQQGNNYHQQQNQRQEAAKVYVAAPAKGRGYAGNLPWCNRCKAHHQPGLCPPRCGKCHKLGHQEGECRTRIPVARDNSLQNVTCFGCGNHGHYRSDCPELKNRN